MEIGLYLHIPFCDARCAYCDFCTTVSQKYRKDYLQALFKEILNWRKKLPDDTVLSSVYFGGGTPTAIPAEALKAFLLKVQELFPIKENAEIAIESNPEHGTLETLSILREAGVNRLSFGMQSAVPKELEILRRQHSVEEVSDAVGNAKAAGFSDISLDLMLGIPEQTVDSFHDSLEFVLSQPITHLSAYMLKLEENTLLYKKSEEYHFPEEDETAEMYLLAVEKLEQAGFHQYEISNFAKNGKESRHNLSYWEQKPYLGLGPGAHSFLNGKRFFTAEHIGRFVEEAGNVSYHQEDGDGLWEYLILRLRLKEGIVFSEAAKKHAEFSTVQQKIVENSAPLIKNHLCELKGEQLFLTPQGFLLSNGVTLALLEDVL